MHPAKPESAVGEYNNVPQWLILLVSAYPYNKADENTLELMLKTFRQVPLPYMINAAQQHTLHSDFFPTVKQLADRVLQILMAQDLHAANILSFILRGYQLIEDNADERYLLLKTPFGMETQILY